MSPEELKGRFSFKEETVVKVQKRVRRDRSFETIGRSTMGRSFGKSMHGSTSQLSLVSGLKIQSKEKEMG